MIIIVTETYPQYVQWLKENVPYFKPGPYTEKFYCSAKLEDDPKLDSTLALQRGSPYMNPYNLELPKYFKFRYKEVVFK